MRSDPRARVASLRCTAVAQRSRGVSVVGERGEHRHAKEPFDVGSAIGTIAREHHRHLTAERVFEGGEDVREGHELLSDGTDQHGEHIRGSHDRYRRTEATGVNDGDALRWDEVVGDPFARSSPKRLARAWGIGPDQDRDAASVLRVGTPPFSILRSRYSEGRQARLAARSEEHTSELQSLMRISYAVFCLKKKINKQTSTSNQTAIK